MTMKRREFLSKAWTLGAAAIAAAAAWTSWDFLQPTSPVGFGGKIKAGPPDLVPEKGVQLVPAARAYLTREEGEIVALWSRCPHLGCRVPWCESSGEFECPCHGTTFNRLGEHRDGPAPRGMDRFTVTIEDDQMIIDTGVILSGPVLGTETIDEPAGPKCESEGHA
ncbi:MAG: Rieske (2Fe-2S) protein [Actinomycetota bacterium]|nr:Rieske (2Fe-2S) protein [Actinomycetota bacterium]